MSISVKQTNYKCYLQFRYQQLVENKENLSSFRFYLAPHSNFHTEQSMSLNSNGAPFVWHELIRNFGIVCIYEKFLEYRTILTLLQRNEFHNLTEVK